MLIINNSHAHHGVGQASIGSVKVINPGAVKMGDFADITIEKNFRGRWSINSLQLRSLISY
jgi:Icc-related predicted phosphoesterase